MFCIATTIGPLRRAARRVSASDVLTSRPLLRTTAVLLVAVGPSVVRAMSIVDGHGALLASIVWHAPVAVSASASVHVLRVRPCVCVLTSGAVACALHVCITGAIVHRLQHTRLLWSSLHALQRMACDQVDASPSRRSVGGSVAGGVGSAAAAVVNVSSGALPAGLRLRGLVPARR